MAQAPVPLEPGEVVGCMQAGVALGEQEGDCFGRTPGAREICRQEGCPVDMAGQAQGWSRRGRPGPRLSLAGDVWLGPHPAAAWGKPRPPPATLHAHYPWSSHPCTPISTTKGPGVPLSLPGARWAPVTGWAQATSQWRAVARGRGSLFWDNRRRHCWDCPLHLQDHESGREPPVWKGSVL